MKVFLLGSHSYNSGPDNVNRDFISVSDERLVYLSTNNKIGKIIEIIKYLKTCDVILISGICSLKILRLIKQSRKPIIYLMHGDIVYENQVNHENIDEKVLNAQNEIFESADKIICVSEKYSEWVGARHTQYKNKITFVNNGLKISRRDKKEKQFLSIAISGGNRPIKANNFVCDAIKILQSKGQKYKVYVFGRNYPNCDELPELDNMQYLGQLDEREYYEYLDKIELFIMNSDVESFGLSVADAINCNCSLLMSNNIGALSIFQIKEEDTIINNHNANEIAEKVSWIQEHPNTDRLYNSLKLDEISVRSSYDKLMKICEDVFIEHTS